VLTVSFAIVFGGIVLAVALAVGLGARTAAGLGGEQRWREEEREAEEPDEIHHM
jgi:hypothetical protein